MRPDESQNHGHKAGRPQGGEGGGVASIGASQFGLHVPMQADATIRCPASLGGKLGGDRNVQGEARERLGYVQGVHGMLIGL